MKSTFINSHLETWRLLVNCQCFTKFCSLFARRKLLIFIFENEFHIIQCICLNWCIGTICSKFFYKRGRGTVSLIYIFYIFLDLLFLLCFLNWGMLLLKKDAFFLYCLTRQSSVFIPLTVILQLVIELFL